MTYISLKDKVWLYQKDIEILSQSGLRGAELLVELRRVLGLSISELGLAVDINPAVISMLENKRRSITKTYYQPLGAFFGIDGQLLESKQEDKRRAVYDPIKQAQYNKKYLKQHKGKHQYLSKRATAKSFITDLADEEDCDVIEQLLKERRIVLAKEKKKKKNSSQ